MSHRRGVLNRLRRLLYSHTELRVYRHTVQSAAAFREDANVSCGRAEALREFEATESWHSRSEFVSSGVSRLAAGEKFFSVSVNGRLMHWGWMIEKQQSAFLTEVKQWTELPDHCGVLYDFYSHPEARGRGLYQRSLATMLKHASRIPTLQYVYIFVEADNGPSRHVIEKLGFDYQRSLFRQRCLIFSRRWGTSADDRNESANGTCSSNRHAVSQSVPESLLVVGAAD